METMKREGSVDELAEALEASQSGFHAHLRKSEGLRHRADQRLRPLIRSSFERSRATYGCLRIRWDLRQWGERCGKNRVARLMCEEGLRPRQKRRFRPGTTESRHNHKITENWLAKVPAPDRPGRIWQSDITYIETAEGWLYLAFTLDGCSRRVVAHHCREDLVVELTTTTFDLAAIRQRPAAGLIHHSDRGSQYAAEAFQRRLNLWRVTSRMSRKANPYDNALAESFVATLKTECFANSIAPTKAAAKLMIFDYIETFYNTRRRHSALGYCSPAQFEKDWLCSKGEGCSGGAAKAARPASKDRSALAALAVNNSPELFKPPETTRFNHLQTFSSTP
jgi:putative transposase